MTDKERLETLRKCRAYYERIISDIDAGADCLVEIRVKGEKHGVGNPAGCRAAITGMIAEIGRQIDALAEKLRKEAEDAGAN